MNYNKCYNKLVGCKEKTMKSKRNKNKNKQENGSPSPNISIIIWNINSKNTLGIVRMDIKKK